LVSAPPILELTNFDFIAGRVVLDDSEKAALLEMASLGKVNIRVESDQPLQAMDCERAATDIAEKADVNRVRCIGSQNESVLSTAFQFKQPTFRHIVTGSSGGYETMEYTNWDINVDANQNWQIADGSHVLRQSDFSYERGLVPVLLNGITIFVEADVQVNEPWRTIDNGVDDPEPVVVSSYSGRRFYIQCGNYEFFEDKDYFPNDIPGHSLELSDNFDTYCADEDIVYRFENMRNADTESGGYVHLTTVSYTPQPVDFTPTAYIGTYSNKLQVKLNESSEDFLFYHGLYNPTQGAELGVQQDAAAYELSVQEYSLNLKTQMLEFAADEDEHDITVTSSDVEDLVYRLMPISWLVPIKNHLLVNGLLGSVSLKIGSIYLIRFLIGLGRRLPLVLLLRRFATQPGSRSTLKV